mmetsp:Transcript_16089/g.56040  ORF Transcript_16089/g.56040 Transcript_16089/m.56040 type:complete len:274 (+) Transcript_16089:202-1023(+)
MQASPPRRRLRPLLRLPLRGALTLPGSTLPLICARRPLLGACRRPGVGGRPGNSAGLLLISLLDCSTACPSEAHFVHVPILGGIPVDGVQPFGSDVSSTEVESLVNAPPDKIVFFVICHGEVLGSQVVLAHAIPLHPSNESQLVTVTPAAGPLDAIKHLPQGAHAASGLGCLLGARRLLCRSGDGGDHILDFGHGGPLGATTTALGHAVLVPRSGLCAGGYGSRCGRVHCQAAVLLVFRLALRAGRGAIFLLHCHLSLGRICIGSVILGNLGM